MEEDNRWYWIGYYITGVLIFIGTWIYAIASYGFLIGVAFGWFPAAIVALLLSFAWPLLALLLGLFIVVVILENT